MISADIKFEGKRDKDIIYQTIRIIPNKSANLRYFMYDRYLTGRTLDDFLSAIYYGDGINIKFKEKHKFRNQITIKYDIINDIPVDLSPKQIHIKTESPAFDGCIYCSHFNENKNGISHCTYYKIFLKRVKKSCVDFFEKDR